jgi:uncharacterized membrane protein YuzA (DUF378 family)
MTIQDAIEMYDEINVNSIILLIIFGMAMMLIGLAFNDDLKNIKGASKTQKSLIVVVIVGALCVITGVYQVIYEIPKEFTKWEETVKKEYINKLPIEKIEVLNYKGIGQKVNDNKLKIEFTFLNKTLIR